MSRLWISAGNHFRLQYGSNWNEANQSEIGEFKQVDFTLSQYEHKGQLRDYQKFLLENTDTCYLFYDEEKQEVSYDILPNDEKSSGLCYKKINIWT